MMKTFALRFTLVVACGMLLTVFPRCAEDEGSTDGGGETGTSSRNYVYWLGEEIGAATLTFRIYRYDVENDTVTRYDGDVNVPSGGDSNSDAFDDVDSYSVLLGGKIYYWGTDASEGTELWVFDPALDLESGVNPKRILSLTTGATGSVPNGMFAFGDKLVFMDSRSPGVYVYDPAQAESGSNPGTLLNNGGGPLYAAEASGKIYFGRIGHTDLYTYDPAVVISGTNPTSSTLPDSSTTRSDFFAHKGKIYYRGQDATQGQELWEADPAQAFGAGNPVRISAAAPSGFASNSHTPGGFISVGDILYYFGNDAPGSVRNLYKYDPSQAANYPTNPSPVTTTNFTHAEQPVQVDGVLYFMANDGTNGRELWKFDTSQAASGTNPAMVVNLDGGAANSLVSHDDYQFRMLALDGKIFFGATDGTNGRELWMYDTTQAVSSGTNPKMVNNVGTGTEGTNPQFISGITYTE